MSITRSLRFAAPAAAVVLVLCAGAPARAQPKDAKGAPAGKPPPGMPVKAVAATTAPAPHTATAVGSLRADESIVIRPEIAGRIARIGFDEGQAVQKGAVLVQLDAAEYRAQVESSTAQAKLDMQRLERAEDLYQKRFIAEQALDEARSNAARSVAKQREDEARFAKTEIRAPFSGVAGLRLVSEGAVVAAGTDIGRLDKIDQLKLDFRLSETYLAQLRAGQRLRVAVDSYPGAAFEGHVYALDPAIDEQTRTVLVRARVPNNAGKLRPGMFARVQITLGVRENAVWVPEEAIVPRGQDSFVFRVTGGRAELVQVVTGVRKVGAVQIEKGIAAGDLVITEGAQKIGPGAPVTVMGEPPKRSADNKAGPPG